MPDRPAAPRARSGPIAALSRLPGAGLASRATDAVAGFGALLRAGALQPVGPVAAVELLEQLIREGVKYHLIFALHAKRTPTAPALIHDGRILTWAELYERILRLSNWYQSNGIGPGDAVAILLPNVPEFVEAQAAALRIGATAAFMNHQAPVRQARMLLRRMDARLLITYRPEVATTGLPVLQVGDDYELALDVSSPSEEDVGRASGGKVVIFTSGTTGTPKGAIRDMGRSSSLSTFAGLLRTIPLRHGAPHLVVLPLYHAAASGFATVSQVLGNGLVLAERFTPQSFCQAVQEWQVGSTAVVPSMLYELCNWRGARKYDLSSLEVVVCTGSPLPPEIRTKARRLFGDVVYDLYGGTEVGWVSVAGPEDQHGRKGTVGRPVPGVEVRILDRKGRPVDPGQTGEVWVTNDLLMEGYLRDARQTGKRLRDGFASLGDVGYLDEDGYLYLRDRADDMILTGGENVYPAEVERALTAHRGVEQAAVFGLPDPKWGQRVVTVVVPSGSGSAPKEAELIAWAKDKLPFAAVPKEVRFVDELPRNHISKVDKHALADEWTATAKPKVRPRAKKESI